MSNGRISQESLDVILHERAKVAEGNGKRRRYPNEPEAPRSIGLKHNSQQHGKHRGLGRGGHESNDRRWSALVHVGSPDVKGSSSDFETQSNEHQGDTGVGQHRNAAGTQHLADGADAGRSGGPEHQSDAVKKKRGRERPKQDILDRSLAADGSPAAEPGEDVGGN